MPLQGDPLGLPPLVRVQTVARLKPCPTYKKSRRGPNLRLGNSKDGTEYRVPAHYRKSCGLSGRKNGQYEKKLDKFYGFWSNSPVFLKTITINSKGNSTGMILASQAKPSQAKPSQAKPNNTYYHMDISSFFAKGEISIIQTPFLEKKIPGKGVFLFFDNVLVYRRGRRDRREIKGKGKLLHNVTQRKASKNLTHAKTQNTFTPTPLAIRRCCYVPQDF